VGPQWRKDMADYAGLSAVSAAIKVKGDEYSATVPAHGVVLLRLAASAAVVVYVAAGVQLFYDYEVLGFGVTATIALTLIWDRPYPTEAHLASTFSPSFVVMLGTLVAIGVAWVALQLDRTGNASTPRSSQPPLVPDAFSNREHGWFA